MQIEQVEIEKLIPYARNSRTHGDSQIAQIAASIKEFGFTNPVLIDEGNGIIAGHGRVLGAQRLNLTEVPCIRLAHLNNAQKRAYVIADNKIALNAGWDEEMLRLEIGELKDFDFDLSLIGFDSAEIDQMLALNDATTEGNTDEDDVPEVQSRVISNLGDVWLLGKHRLMCGDSTNAVDVEKLLGGGMPHLMVTDPPYGVEYDPSYRSDNKLKSGKVLNDNISDWRAAWALFAGDVAYVWHASLFTHTVLASLEACDFERRAMIIWVKNNFTLGRSNYHWKHEPAWYVVRKNKTAHFCEDRTQTTVWNINEREDAGHGHSTPKPVECMRRPIENNSLPGDGVYEPFSGSGTTIIAAEQTGRICYAMELNPPYVDMAIRRWQQFTGKFAVHESTGKTFAELEAA